MTSIPKVLTSLAVAGSMLAGQALVASSDASAREFRHRGDGARFHAPAPRYFAPRHVAPRHYGPRYGYAHRRDRSGDAVAATILGLGAVIIGSAIANAHKNRPNHRDYDGYDD